MLFCTLTVYSFNGRVPKIFLTSGLMCNSTKISVGPILRTCENQVVLFERIGQSIGSMRGDGGLLMAPSSVPSQAQNAALQAPPR